LESNEEAVTSLKAYRVEFVAPLTEYPGTENEKGELKKATQCSNKSKINFSKPAKKKPLVQQRLCIHPPFRVDK
jgi:hypothetical protein